LDRERLKISPNPKGHLRCRLSSKRVSGTHMWNLLRLIHTKNTPRKNFSSNAVSDATIEILLELHIQIIRSF